MTTLADLKPTKRQYIMDLVAQAGIDVSNWSNFKGGSAKARINPRYCHEWAFDDRDKVVITLWHADLESVNGRIERRFNIDEHVRAEHNTTRKARRARMRAILFRAKEAHLPIRVIVVDGPRVELSVWSNAVRHRLLDPVPWAVVALRNDAEVILRRGVPAAPLVDQFWMGEHGTDAPERSLMPASAFARDGAVRQAVLERSVGLCEYCKAPGIRTAGGQIYLETHHVVPLAEGGGDGVRNVIALCPNDHRRAHHGAQRDEMRAAFLKYLESL
jgi:5-methylcytosine-specific restriction protein A